MQQYDEALFEYYQIPRKYEFLIPSFLSDAQIDLIMLMGHEIMEHEQLVGLIHEKMSFQVSFPDRFIADSYHDTILDKVISEEGKLCYKLGEFYNRIACCARYEYDKWVLLDEKVRFELDQYILSEYLARGVDETITQCMNGGIDPKGRINEFIDLEDAKNIIDHASAYVFQFRCDCRSYVHRCDNPLDNCIHFGKPHINSPADRGHGKRLTKEEAFEVCRQANKHGLMQNFELHSGGICNCCACCCIPIRTSIIKGSNHIWPIPKAFIEIDQGKCIKCGKCVKICHFGALSKEKGQDSPVVYDKEKCRGCTLCYPNCPSEAIKLVDKREVKYQNLDEDH
ncbi:ATP-binding protein [Candidatus Formimonas warabiya]|uniref:4Fe-4S ferredoxin-type domain-containing protein n=1 Tax=Formimonas warabiya TaxID=1761012 RepID=A0A3G1KS10_FORW1|nr:4Fe-4S dicluster-binding protein [Candidatus Formimonas warabiya]ATW25174.1 hypothetical protein DCMF_10695 [Candidatus Formimonas warabiya]